MQKKWKKHLVFMPLRNNNGFTLLQTLMTITIIVMTIPFINYLLKNSSLVGQYNDIAVQQFFIFMGEDIYKAEKLSVEKGELILERNDERAVYRLFNGTIRRQLKGGQEFYLRDVNNFEAKILPYGCKLIVIDNNGETYEKIFLYYEK